MSGGSWRPRAAAPRRRLLDPHHLHRVQVDDRQEVRDRARVAVVVGKPGTHVAPARAVGFLRREPKCPPTRSRPSRAPSPSPRGGAWPPASGGRPGPSLRTHVLVEHDGGLDTGYVPPGQHPALGQRDDGLVGPANGAVHEHHEGGALHGVPGPAPEHDLLLGLVQHDEDHPALRARRPLRRSGSPRRPRSRRRRAGPADVRSSGCRGGRCHARSSLSAFDAPWVTTPSHAPLRRRGGPTRKRSTQPRGLNLWRGA